MNPLAPYLGLIKLLAIAAAIGALLWGIHALDQSRQQIGYDRRVVFSREGGGHVGFVVGQQPDGKLLVLGGNQGDAVTIKAFDRARVTGYRWPVDVPIANAPLQLGAAETSRSEA